MHLQQQFDLAGHHFLAAQGLMHLSEKRKLDKPTSSQLCGQEKVKSLTGCAAIRDEGKLIVFLLPMVLPITIVNNAN